MNTVSDFLFPAQPLTPLLAACACLTGMIVGGLTARFCPRKSTNLERVRKAFGYGGMWGVAVCLLILVTVAKLDRTLPPLELADALIQAFLTAGIAGALTQQIAAWLLCHMRAAQVPHLPEFPPLAGNTARPRRMPEDLGIPAISTRRR